MYSSSLKRLPTSATYAAKKLSTGSHKQPKTGHVFMCIGKEQRQFEIPVEYLKHDEMVQLLWITEEFQGPADIKIADGLLRIRWCTVDWFLQVLKNIEKKQQ
ncbi:hypothetical protein LINGRAHAP2_LOCUS36479 [Linum grandiflorum]